MAKTKVNYIHIFYSVVIIFVTVFGVILLIQAYSYQIKNNKLKNPKNDQMGIEDCVKLINNYNRVRLYADQYIHITKVEEAVNRSNNQIILEGKIQNNGILALNDIELRVFFVDSTVNVLRQEKYPIPSIDGKPLRTYDKRPFRIIINDTIDQSLEIRYFITGIDFATESAKK